MIIFMVEVFKNSCWYCDIGLVDFKVDFGNNLVFKR